MVSPRVSLVIRDMAKIFSIAEVIFLAFLAEFSAAEAHISSFCKQQQKTSDVIAHEYSLL